MAEKKTKKKTRSSARAKSKEKASSKSADVSKEIRRAVDTGKVVFGRKETEKSLLVGKSKLIILSSNIPELVREKAVHIAEVAGVPHMEFDGTALQLGSVCGKPFGILVMSIEDAGKSNIVSAARSE